MEIRPGTTSLWSAFNIEFIHVNHSIPDAVGLAIRCPAGVIIQTGDFKIDTTPVDGDMIDLARFAEYGKKGVLALLSDSTNAERPGYTMSERKVGESFEQLFRKAHNKRIVVATFASNIHRVQQIIDVAQSRGRKVAVTGRSLKNLVQVGQDLGYLNVPENILIPIDAIKRYPDDKLVIITTGSQGEPMSALTRIAFGEHRKVNIGPQRLCNHFRHAHTRQREDGGQCGQRADEAQCRGDLRKDVRGTCQRPRLSGRAEIDDGYC